MKAYLLAIEGLARSFEHSISALATIGTWAAVFVSLRLATAASRPKLRISVEKSVFIPSEAQESGTIDWDVCDDMVSATLQNLGSGVTHISYWAFSWRLPIPWTGALLQNPLYPDFRRESIKLEPGQAA